MVNITYWFERKRGMAVGIVGKDKPSPARVASHLPIRYRHGRLA